MRLTATTSGTEARGAALLAAGLLLSAGGAAAQTGAGLPGTLGTGGAPGLAAGSSPFAVDAGTGLPAGIGSPVPSSPLRPPVRLGGFFESPFGGPPVALGSTAPSRPYEFIPTLTARVTATDRARLGGTGRGGEGEVITSVVPSLAVRANTARVQGTVSYAPNFNFYLNDTQPSRVDHRFFGAGTLVAIPDALFVDVRALSTLSPINPGLNQTNTLTDRRSDLAQNYFFSVSPYYIQRFGSLATGIVGYQFSYNDRQAQTLRVNPANPFSPSVGGSEALTTHTGYAALRTGEDFGRLAMEARVSGSAFTGGSAVTDGASRMLAVLESRYAITRTVSVLAEGGWENLRFGGVTPYRVNGPVWGFGVRLDPSPNSTITVRYRRRDGFDSPQAEARVQLGPRTVAFGRYLEAATTSLRQTSDLLSAITVDELGNAVDSRTGAPAPELGGVGFLGAQNGLFRSRRGTLSVSQFLPRGTITLQYLHDQRSPLSVAPGQAAFSQEGDTVSLIGQRPLSEVTSAFGSVGYSWNRSGTFNSRSETLNGRVGVSHRFSDSLFGSLQYQLIQRTSSVAGTAGNLAPRDATQNSLIGSLTARF
ncbi:TIGR03016 family PEP-CTERM system-associated outer membrane protein [Roseococcus sp. DSY-14]|uniref:TIGR03016 family PEP-CTERM system-associated outer membrane protein n=1 Tax=Roseococcus sp. DSY-14 TaxID=3369650 RepID=UPI00387B88DD